MNSDIDQNTSPVAKSKDTSSMEQRASTASYADSLRAEAKAAYKKLREHKATLKKQPPSTPKTAR